MDFLRGGIEEEIGVEEGLEEGEETDGMSVEVWKTSGRSSKDSGDRGVVVGKKMVVGNVVLGINIIGRSGCMKMKGEMMFMKMNIPGYSDRKSSKIKNFVSFLSGRIANEDRRRSSSIKFGSVNFRSIHKTKTTKGL